MRRLLLTFTLLLVTIPALAQRVEATLYFIPWDVETRARLSADDVRRLARLRIQYLDRGVLEDLVGTIGRLPMTVAQDESSEDVRLVIDIDLPNGTKRTFAASRFRILDSMSRTAREVNSHFRDRFSAVLAR